VKPTSYRDLISGRQRGLGANLARGGLKAASVIYGAAVSARNLAFDRGLLTAHRASVPVVSIGNLTTGGTGKTPMVAAVVNWFSSRGVRPAILSRGYRAHTHGANDEKLVLDQQCPGVAHLQGADRVQSARAAIDAHAAQVLVLDDGFQHRWLARDLDLVLVDALDPWGGGGLLPRGLLREPISSLRRADAVLLTRADQCAPEDKARLVGEICRAGRGEPPLEVIFRPTALVDFDGANAAFESLTSVAAFCGIGNPEGFGRTLLDAGLKNVSGFRSFSDHHYYTGAELSELASWARELRAAALVTTQKDIVKIARNELEGVPLWSLPIRAEIVVGADRFEAILHRVLHQQSSPKDARHE
jgi:tetraacyldisaccharide 4'-kinase